jgi:hypothetical protein
MPDVSAWRKKISLVAFESIAPARRTKKMRTMAPAVKMRERRANTGPGDISVMASSIRRGSKAYWQP